jgi:hypothetical protein
MLNLGSLSFALPAALFALLLLPLLWWLLRAMPPAPRRVAFPPVRLLAQLASTEESVRRTPLWLLVLRVAAVAALILGISRPILDAGTRLAGLGPVILVVDDGWAAAADWPLRRALLETMIGQTERENRELVLATTAPVAGDAAPPPPRISTAVEAREVVRALQPKPWPGQRGAVVAGLREFAGLAGRPPGAVFWVTDGLDEETGSSLATLVQSLRRFGAVTLLVPEGDDLPPVLRPPEGPGETLVVQTAQPAAANVAVWIKAIADDDLVLDRQQREIAAGQRQSRIVFSLPAEQRNRLARIEIDGATTAAAVVLLDERWRRRPVGLVDSAGSTGDLPLLSSLYYLERALEPFAEARRGGIEALLARELAVLILPDGSVADETAASLVLPWIQRGGILVRFAGPKLGAETRQDDPLLPVRLRLGDRFLGGSLAWQEPASLAPFDRESPFYGLSVPAEVRIHRQVLAVPSIDLDRTTWARLSDGTPLITAAKRQDGWTVLIHTTANTEWSNLPLSLLFVQMLERIVAFSQGAVAEAGGPPLAPWKTLDGFGRLGPPPAGARPVAAEALSAVGASSLHPPGIYGEGSVRRAVNLGSAIGELKPVGELPSDVSRRPLAVQAEVELRPWLLAGAMALAILDLAVSMAMRGLLRMPGRLLRRLRPGAALLVVALLPAPPAAAQQILADGTADPSALVTRLAYVLTGDAVVDTVSRAGLSGLSAMVNRRTAAELGEPVGVAPERDELAYYPFLYWPVLPGGPVVNAPAASRLRAYMTNGGTLVFDTRQQGASIRLEGLRELARALDLPPLIPAPREHVLGRAYYLLDEFPGRWTGGTVWVERGGERINDGVTSVIVGGHDWAGAWAVDDALRPMFAVVPGGERQRELAFRFGINLVMHVLTGNYKADQVHLPAILERLGR